MKLIALVIKQYNKLFKEQIFNFSYEYKVDFNFETNELKIDKNLDYIENFKFNRYLLTRKLQTRP